MYAVSHIVLNSLILSIVESQSRVKNLWIFLDCRTLMLGLVTGPAYPTQHTVFYHVLQIAPLTLMSSLTNNVKYSLGPSEDKVRDEEGSSL